MKSLTQFITEKQNFLINSKINSTVKSSKSNKILYTPKSWNELYEAIKNLLDKGETNLNCIDTSNINDMSYLFREVNKRYDITGIDVSGWDVSNVENMIEMFCNCNKFDCDISNWNTSNNKDMTRMFSGCHNFNCDLSNWDISNVEDMIETFKNCENFDCDLSNWDVSNVEDAYCMFYKCEKFKGKGLENWNVDNVQYMKNMFINCKSFKNKPSWYKK